MISIGAKYHPDIVLLNFFLLWVIVSWLVFRYFILKDLQFFFQIYFSFWNMSGIYLLAKGLTSVLSDCLSRTFGCSICLSTWVKTLATCYMFCLLNDVWIANETYACFRCDYSWFHMLDFFNYLHCAFTSDLRDWTWYAWQCINIFHQWKLWHDTYLSPVKVVA